MKMTVTGDTLLSLFSTKIEDAVSLVPEMEAEEKLKAVQFWNAVSGKLQEIINNSAADIDNIAMSLNENNKKMQLPIDCSPSNNNASNIASQNNFYTSEFMNGASNLIVCNESNSQFIPENFSNSQPRPYLQSSPANSFQLNCYSDVNSTLDSSVDCIEHCPDQGINLSMNSYSKLCSLADIGTQEEHDSTKVSNSDITMDTEPNTNQKSMCKRPNNSLIVQSPTKLQQLLCTNKETTISFSETSLDSSKDSEVQTEDLDKDSALLELCNNVENLDDLQSSVAKITDSELPTDIAQTDDLVCEWCEQEFTDALSLHTHHWTHTKPYSCSECDAQFSSKGNLIVHYRKHTGEKPYLCSFDLCSARFSTKGNLKRHCKTHSGEKPFECNQCRSRFTEKKSLKIHMRRHTGEKPYACNICSMKFSQSGILQSHIALHMDEKEHLCEHCGKAFRQKSQLRLHMMRHNGVKNYFCNSCPSRFLTKGDLDRHCRTHTGERPFACSLCKKTFTRQQSLKEHMNRHYGHRPYECKECGKTFFEMSACYKHIKQHNKGTQRTDENGQKENGTEKMITHVVPNSLNSAPPNLPNADMVSTDTLQGTEKFTVILRNSGQEIEVCSRLVLDGNTNELSDHDNFPKDLSTVNLLAVDASSQEQIQQV